MFDSFRKRIDGLLTGPVVEALRWVDYAPPSYGVSSASAEEAVRGQVQVGHISGSPEARYQLHALGEVMELSVQLNVYRLVIVYRIPVVGAMDDEALRPRFARWEIGANDAGWKVGWRNTVDEIDTSVRRVEVYCYAALPEDFLESERHQLYWITDIVQMIRAFILESKRIDVRLSAVPTMRRSSS